MKKQFRSSRLFFSLFLFVFCCVMPMKSLRAQDYVTGAFEGQVRNSATGETVPGATVRITNNDTGVPIARQTDSQGRFRQALLPPGDYTIRVSKEGFVAYESQQSLPPMTATIIVPVPVNLKPEAPAPVATATPSEVVAPNPNEPPKTPAMPTQTPQVERSSERSSIRAEINTTDAQRGGTYGEKEVSTLPLGGVTLTRSFDELGLLIPGVALPPMTEGGGSGPGVGGGVGTSGQFAVNGLRSRANNFTVDGSDNNDEDIGVRRQGFFALVPQPIESIQVYQVITLLAPAQYGRNFGAQVNAVSKSGGNQFHGVLYGFLNSDRLNSRNFFDTANGNAVSALRAGNNQAVLLDGSPLMVRNQSGGEDSFKLGQGGFILGGPIKKDKAFFFVSYEKQVLNASKEASFAVPTVDRRGIFNTGATGIFADCRTPLDLGFNITNCTPANRSHFFPEFGYPTAVAGDGVFSLFPFPNNPTGVYGANTYTESLPASARGDIASGKFNQNFELRGKPQTFTARYNFTQDRRDIPVTGGALFSSLRPRVRTQNLSTFLTSQLTNSISNVLSLSYGRTRLAFDELRDPFLLQSQVSPNEKFLLNARLLVNNTINPQPVGNVGVPNTGPVLYATTGTTECGFPGATCSASRGVGGLGRVGQVNIAGFSPIGVDVNNFPQNRVNNTYQVSDVLGYQHGKHSFAFGADIRRVELNSNLQRNSRTRLSYQGAPEVNNANLVFTGNFIPGIDFAAAGAPSGAFLSLSRAGTNAISLRYHEFNFFGQDTWRIRKNLSLNFGVRYEYNTPAKETHNLIERTFNDALLNDPNAVGLKKFIAGRTGIFEASRTNFAPRFGLAWSPTWFGPDHTTVIRAGFGLFYDQILGAVVSQSRNVFPNFITVNTGGFRNGIDPINGLDILGYFNPARDGFCFARNAQGSCTDFRPLVQSGTLNTLNPLVTPANVLNTFASGGFFPNGISVTLPDRNIKPPSAEHYSVSFEQQLNANLVLSAGYVGTRGHNLLRASTPN
ncbi:MAG: TonB-dependent receptor, partial [bacterium]